MNETEIAVQKDVLRGRKPRTLLLDIETFPVNSYNWGIYEQNAIQVIDNTSIACIGMKWLDEKKVHVFALPDYKGYKPKSRDDKALCGTIHEFLEQADYIIAHNLDKFDIKKINYRLIVNGYKPVSPYKQIDTLKVARKYFGFDSNKLDDLGRQLGVGRKTKHSGFEMWKGCMEGDMKAWAKMIAYNRQDVILLEKVYLKMRGWNTTHPNGTFFTRRSIQCKTCLSTNLYKQGIDRIRAGWRQKYQCLDCGAWMRGDLEKQKDDLLT